MIVPEHDHALSEIIGFILILGIIIVAFSLYLLYAVPSQGRESEITHMNDIRDQFVAYKIGVDALWTNNQVGTAMSISIPLGSQSGSTQGFLSFIPVINPVPSSGTLAVSQRKESLTITSRGISGDGRTVYNETIAPESFPVNATPLQFDIIVSDSAPSDYTSGQRSVLLQGSNWDVNVTIVPRTTSFLEAYSCNPTGCLYRSNISYSGTDIAIDITKDGVTTLQDYTVYKNIAASQNYSINLLDDAYGLRKFLDQQDFPMTVFFTNIPASSTLTGYSILDVPDEYDRYSSHSVDLGALEYYSNNNYWIPQTYYYQNGGVFLQQDEGTAVKLPPEITFSCNPQTTMTGVRLNELPYKDTNFGSVGGSGMAKVTTKVMDINNLSYSSTYANTRWINISFQSDDNRAVNSWYQFLDTAANVSGGVPESYYSTGLSGGQAFLLLHGIDTTDASYDVHAEGIRVNLSATIQGS